MENKETKSTKRQLMISVLLVLLALVSVTAATTAWFTIANRTKVYSMSMEITSGTNLRFDLDAHETFDDYVKELSFAQIADRMERDLGFDMRTVPLEPVTTKDVKTFTFEDGTVADKKTGAYLEFTLHFMATEDMLLHLTCENSDKKNNGTVIESSRPDLKDAMRISFTADNQSFVYDPGMGDTSTTANKIKTFGMAEQRKMVPNKNNQLVWLKKNEDCPIVVRIWLEGEDPACSDAIRDGDYRIRLRFVGTDSEHHILTQDR